MSFGPRAERSNKYRAYVINTWFTAWRRNDKRYCLICGKCPDMLYVHVRHHHGHEQGRLW